MWAEALRAQSLWLVKAFLQQGYTTETSSSTSTYEDIFYHHVPP